MRNFAIVILVSLLVSACAGRKAPAPVESIGKSSVPVRTSKSILSDVYKVKKGETLFSIAWRADMDVKYLAAINKVKPPFRIFPGQTLYLDEKRAKQELARAAKKPDKSKDIVYGTTSKKSASKGIAPSKKQEYGESAGDKKIVKKTSVPKQPFSKKVRKWRWPVKGKILKYFSTKPDGSKGVDIAGKRGDIIRAAADGKVVYTGNALSGYGNLVIIKHNDDYLSAYAHNDTILVKEQQNVRVGDKVAKMGSTDSDRVNLHFEIRFRGKSVNPLKYLPKL